MNKGARFLWLSHFSNRPGQIFNGAQNRLTIVITSGKTGRQQFFSTKYNRWDAKNGEREGLLPALRFQEINQDAYIFEGIFPKIGCPEAWSVFQKISQRNTIDELIAKQGKYKIYWVRVPGYFCVFLLDPPLARPQDGGEPRIRGEVNNIGFDYRMAQNVVHCVLNSAVYYQYFCAYTDTRHINPSDVRQFPLDLASFSDAMKSDLAVVSGNLSKCFRRHTTQWRKSGLLIDSIETKLCKRQIDEIDCVLAKHYGFTDEELDFIINYDIKYRMGGAVEMEDEV